MSILDRFSLEGRVALVTGGAGPLVGSSVTEGLAESGATVVTASRSLEKNEALAEKMRAEGYDVHGMSLDTGNSESINRLHGELIKRFRKLDVLVNSAAAYDGHVGGFEQTPEALQIVGASDFSGLVQLCQKFIPDMVKQGSGSVINISSIWSVVSDPLSLQDLTGHVHVPSYVFMKGGQVSFTRYLACHYGKAGIRANAISYGAVGGDHQPEMILDWWEEGCPLSRMVNSDDIKASVAYLASDASAFVTGQNLIIDGGWTSQ